MSYTSVTVLPIYSEAGAGARAPFLIGVLLSVDETRILLDCGWSEFFDASAVLEPLRRIAPSLDAVVLSFGDIAHAGALPLLYRSVETGGAGCIAPVYMTPPANRFASLTLCDAHRARALEEPEWEAGAFRLADVDAAFAFRAEGGPVTQVRFLEESAVRGGVLVTAYAAGYSLGGAMWRVVRGVESIIFAPMLNHRNEGHLPKALLSSLLKSPSALIVDGGFAGEAFLEGKGVAPSLILPPATFPPDTPPRPLEAWESSLVEAAVRVLQRGGSVLMPTDTAGRSLEVLYRLDAEYGTRYQWPIFFVNHKAFETLECARTNLEFMGDDAAKAFSLGATSTGAGPGSDGEPTPFSFRADRSRVRAAASLDHVAASIAAGWPCIILASFASLGLGLSRSIFMQLAADPKNAVIFTSRAAVPADSVAAQLVPIGKAASPLSLTFTTTSTVPLVGAELAAWKEAREEERSRAARVVAVARARMREADELSAATAAATAAAAEAAAAAAAALATASVFTTEAVAMEVDAAAAAAASRNVYLEDDSEAIMSIEDIDDALHGTVSSVGGAGSLRALAWRAGGPTSRFPTFSRDAPRDALFANTDYGLQVDPAAFMDLEGTGDGSPTAALSSTAESAGQGPAALTPFAPQLSEPLATKRVRSTLTMRVQCRVAMHALDGCTVGESLVHVLEAAMPLRLIVLAGCASPNTPAAEAASALARAVVDARVLSANAVSILDASCNEPLDVSSHVSELKLRVLHAAAASDLDKHTLALAPPLLRVGDTHSLAYVETQILAVARSTEEGSEMSSSELFLAAAEGDEGHLPLIIRAGGPLRLSNLRQRLRKAGIIAEVIEGALITRGGVIVRRFAGAGGALNVEGPPVPELFRVREIVAEEHVFVA